MGNESINYTPGPESVFPDRATRLAAAHAADIERNRARQSGTAEAHNANLTGVAQTTGQLGDRNGWGIGTGIAAEIMHDLGLSNTPESLRFVNWLLQMRKDLDEGYRFLEKDAQIGGGVVRQLAARVNDLEIEIADLKRKKGFPLKAETRSAPHDLQGK